MISLADLHAKLRERDFTTLSEYVGAGYTPDFKSDKPDQVWVDPYGDTYTELDPATSTYATHSVWVDEVDTGTFDQLAFHLDNLDEE